MGQKYYFNRDRTRAARDRPHTTTTNNRLPSRSTDTESDYHLSAFRTTITDWEKGESGARTHSLYYDDYTAAAAAAWRSRTHYAEQQLRVNGSDKWVQCCRIRVEYGLRWKRVIIVHTSGRFAAGITILLLLSYELGNRRMQTAAAVASRDFKRVVSRQ